MTQTVPVPRLEIAAPARRASRRVGSCLVAVDVALWLLVLPGEAARLLA